MSNFIDIDNLTFALESMNVVTPSETSFEELGLECLGLENDLGELEYFSRTIGQTSAALVALESFGEIVKEGERDGGLSDTEYQCVFVGIESTLSLINREDLKEVVSNERYRDHLTQLEKTQELKASLESKEEGIKETVVNALKKMGEYISELLESLFDKVVRLSNAAKVLKEKVDKVGELKEDAELKHKTVETAFSSKTSNFTPSNVVTVLNTHTKLVSTAAEGNRIISTVYDRLIKVNYGTEPAKLSDIYASADFGKKHLLPEFANEGVKDEYLKGKTDELVNGTVLIQLITQGGDGKKGVLKIDTDASNSKKSEGGSIAIPKVAEMQQIITATLKLTEKLKNVKTINKKSSALFREMVKHNKTQAKNGRVDLSNTHKDIAQALSNYQRYVFGLSATAAYQGLDYINSSVKLYDEK